MRQFIDVTGKTEDEAIQNALRQLGLDRDDVSVEILERAKSGFLGLGSCPAKVRVSYGPEEEEEVLAPAPAPKEKPQEERPKPPKAEKPPRQERKSAEAPAPAPEEKTRQSAPVQTLGEEVDDEKAQAIRKFLSGLLEQMESAAEIHIYLLEKGRYKVILEGKNLGALIGRRGETLDAIQQLTSYAVNRSGSGRVRGQLEQSLQHLARKVAAKVTKYRRSVTLEPMNAYERHVIHTALQDVPNVTTYSTGTEPNRRVIVAYDREKK